MSRANNLFPGVQDQLSSLSSTGAERKEAHKIRTSGEKKSESS